VSLSLLAPVSALIACGAPTVTRDVGADGAIASGIDAGTDAGINAGPDAGQVASLALFGGLDESTVQLFNDTWTWDGAT
jgi:hypothetical protein